MKGITVSQFIEDVLAYFNNDDPPSIAGIANAAYLKDKVFQLMLNHKKNYQDIINICNKLLN